MKITIELTADFYLGEDFARDGKVMLRLWTGVTEGGIPVHAYIATLSPQTHDPDVNAAFERELVERPVIFNPPEGGSA